LDFTSLQKLNPRLIYCSVTGFGQTGPYKNRAGYDFMIQGMAGVMSITGEPDGRPIKMGVAFADVFAGLHAVIGIQAALIARAKSGQGQHIDISLLDSQVSVLANQAMNYLIGGKVPKRMGNEHPNIVPYQTFETSDGHIIIAAGNDRQFAALCKVIGAEKIGLDKRFATNRGRVELRGELIPILAPFFKSRSTAQWAQALEADAVPCGPINSLDQVFAHEQVLARALVRDVTHTNGTKVKTVSNPIVFSNSANGAQTASPKLGSETDQVLREVLGLDKTERQALRDKGIT
jgi:crotonobetainyl-CoA:carnitine CoA-transferase CaiB-like acyl-CoA transferase